MPIFFAIGQVWACARVIALYEWHKEPIFWMGAIAWGIAGYSLPEVRLWLKKKAIAAVALGLSIIALIRLARTGQFPIMFQFMMWGPLAVVVGSVRLILEGDLLKKYEDVHGQPEPSNLKN